MKTIHFVLEHNLELRLATRYTGSTYCHTAAIEISKCKHIKQQLMAVC